MIADERAKLDPDNSQSQTSAVMGALKDLYQANATDPYTEAINSAIQTSAVTKDNNDRRANLLAQRNIWTARADQRGVDAANKALLEYPAAEGRGERELSMGIDMNRQLRAMGHDPRTATPEIVARALTLVRQGEIEDNVDKAYKKEMSKSVVLLSPALKTLDTLRAKAEKLFTSGFFSRIGSGISANIAAIWQGDPDAAAYLREAKGLIFNLSKAQGNVGTPSDKDMERIEALIADPTDFVPADIRTVNTLFDDVQNIMLSKLDTQHRKIAIQRYKGEEVQAIDPATDAQMEEFYNTIKGEIRE